VTEEIDLRDISFGKKTKVSFKEAQGHLSGTLTFCLPARVSQLSQFGKDGARRMAR